MAPAVKQRVKIQFRLGDARNLTTDSAWACCSTNLVLPGFGSLMGGRIVGYPQALLCVAGFGLTAIFGLKFVIWGVQHWSELQNPNGDPIETFISVWHACRWALLGMLLFALTWCWAALTSWGILRTARRLAESQKPPRLNQLRP